MKTHLRFWLAVGAAVCVAAAAVWLGWPAPPPPGVSPELARWVRQLRARPGLHQRVATSLAGRVHPRASRWLPGFLRTESVERRNLEAAHQLLRFGRGLRPAVPQLAEAFADPRPDVAFYAFMALTYSEVPAAEFVAFLQARKGDAAGGVPFYASLLATEDERVRDFAWACLEASGARAVAVEPRLRDLASEGDPALREQARRLLERLGLPAGGPAPASEAQPSRPAE